MKKKKLKKYVFEVAPVSKKITGSIYTESFIKAHQEIEKRMDMAGIKSYSATVAKEVSHDK
jgi:hypothetical protein